MACAWWVLWLRNWGWWIIYVRLWGSVAWITINCASTGDIGVYSISKVGAQIGQANDCRFSDVNRRNILHIMGRLLINNWELFCAHTGCWYISVFLNIEECPINIGHKNEQIAHCQWHPKLRKSSHQKLNDKVGWCHFLTWMCPVMPTHIICFAIMKYMWATQEQIVRKLQAKIAKTKRLWSRDIFMTYSIYAGASTSQASPTISAKI